MNDQARPIKFGLLLSHQYPAEDDLRVRLDELFGLVHLGRELGYDSVWTIHHYLANLQTPQVISMTAALARETAPMMLGTSVLLAPFLHPVHIAEEFATLDHLTGGRIVLGLGAGYRENEFASFGIPINERFGRLVESVEIVRALFTGESVTYQGKYFQIDNQRLSVPPLQPGGPPIWLGGGGKQAVRRGGTRLSDAWWAPGTSPNLDYPFKAMPLHDEALMAAGKSRIGREYPIGLELYCGETDQSAMAQALPFIRREFEVYSNYEFLKWQGERFDQLVENSFIIGSPDTVAARLERLRDAGYNHMVFRPTWIGAPSDLAQESIRRFAAEVIPRFRPA